MFLMSATAAAEILRRDDRPAARLDVAEDCGIIEAKVNRRV
jgi:hypothetical protein